MPLVLTHYLRNIKHGNSMIPGWWPVTGFFPRLDLYYVYGTVHILCNNASVMFHIFHYIVTCESF